MVLESTMICIDNSDYMRNEDFLPNRLLAQQDAVYILCRSKIQSNPENKVGLVSLADSRVLANLTDNIGHIYSKLQPLQPNGVINFHTGIQLAHLALKHRESKNHKCRIVVFVGSPVTNEANQLIQAAKQFKKEKVNVDIVSFGETSSNFEILDAFISTLNGKDGSNNRLVYVPDGPSLASAIRSSPIIAAGAQNTLETSTFDLGLDNDNDPELAMALLLSLREEEARTARRVTIVEEKNQIVDMPQKSDSNTDLDFSEFSEVEKLMYVLRMASENQATPIDEEALLHELVNDPELLASIYEHWPEVDGQTEAIREILRKLTKKEENEDDDKKNVSQEDKEE